MCFRLKVVPEHAEVAEPLLHDSTQCGIMNWMQWWPVLIALVTLIIILAKMHAAIEVLNEKVKVLFQLLNK